MPYYDRNRNGEIVMVTNPLFCGDEIEVDKIVSSPRKRGPRVSHGTRCRGGPGYLAPLGSGMTGAFFVWVVIPGAAHGAETRNPPAESVRRLHGDVGPGRIAKRL